jgi:hypothetical protein
VIDIKFRSKMVSNWAVLVVVGVMHEDGCLYLSAK